MLELQGKVAVVTGASSGIGEAISFALAERGCKVVCLARREDRLRALVERLQAASHQASHQASYALLDVTDAKAVQQTLQEIEGKFGRIDLLINNAGFGNKREFIEEPLEGLLEMMSTNYLGAVYAMKAVLPGMMARKSGHIVNIGSVAGEYYNPLMAGYCASKAALVAVSTSMAPEVKKHGVTVSVLNPGPIETEFFQNTTWQKYQPHHPPWMITPVGEVVKGLLYLLETKRFKIFVPSWFGWMVWGYRTLGPVADLVVALKRRMLN